MALNWHLIESEVDRESVLQRLSSSLERATPTKDDILRVEALLRDTSIPTELRRDVSRALLKHTRRESTQRLPMLWTASSRDEEFRATDEIVMFDTTVVAPSHHMPNETPTAERNWDEMPLPAEATDESGILSWSADALLEFVPDGPHSLRFHRRVYEGVTRENTLTLLRRGMLLGMDVFRDDGWIRIVDHADFQPLVNAFENEALRVMSRCDITPELETLEDLIATEDITRPLAPDPSFPFEDIDTLFDDEPQTVELGEHEEEEDDYTSKFDEADRAPRPLPPGPLELAASHGTEFDRQGDTMVARPSKTAHLPELSKATLTSTIPLQDAGRAPEILERTPEKLDEPISVRPPAIRVNTARLPALPAPVVASEYSQGSDKNPKTKRRAKAFVIASALVATAAASGFAYKTFSAPPVPKVISIAAEPWRAIAEATRQVEAASQIRINHPDFLIQAATRWADRDHPQKAAGLMELAFDDAPGASAAVDIARMNARAGGFKDAREWLQKASELGAPDAEILPLLGESFREDSNLRSESVALLLGDGSSLNWDESQRHFRIQKNDELTGFFVPNRRGKEGWAEQVAESRLCEAMNCPHRVPNAYPAHVSVSELKLPRGVREDRAGVIEGAFVEAPELELMRTPVEMQNVWSGWLSADAPLPSGPYAARLLAWDRLDPNLRPDFANLAVPTLSALEFSRQISSIFVVDALVRNDARASRRSQYFGHTTGFDGTHLVSMRASSMPSRMPSRLRDHVDGVERIDKFEWLALQAMTPDTMYGVFDALSVKQRQIIWHERSALVERYSRLVQEKGALNVLLPR
jgi:hypothetical protein